MKILGLHDGHCASAALLEDGVLKYALQEERMVNKKNEPGLPVNAIKWIISQIGDVNELDEIALSTLFIHEADWYRRQGHWEKGRKDYLANKVTWPIRKRFDPYFTHRLDNRKRDIRALLTELGAKKEIPIKVVEHHQAHAASAYYSSPLEHPLIMTADGSGDGLSATVSTTIDGYISRIEGLQCTRDESPGELYSMVTYYMGFRPWDHEYKLMGMAPYSKVNEDVYSGLMKLIAVEKARFRSSISADFAYNELKKLLYRKRFDEICAGLQEWFEAVMCRWFEEVYEGINTNYKMFDMEGSDGTFACAGGDFMNVKANMKIAELPCVKDIFFMPSAGDESTSIGAAMQVYADYCVDHGMNPKREIKPLQDLYLGPDAIEGDGLETEMLLDVAKNRGEISVIKAKNMETLVAETVESGGIVARCTGRLEFGARALGNRSILADPRSLQSIDTLNSQIKQRDFWMPFTPSVMEDQVKRYVENPKLLYAPYMIQCFPSTEEGRRDLKAAMHRYDFTIRPQMVRRSWNEDYYRLLYRWMGSTGVGGMLNTSFNLHGYPICKDVQTALWTMKNSKLKFISAGPYFITKV